MKNLLTNESPAVRRGGFSLIELMVVIVIIALLATQLVPRVADYFGAANKTTVMKDISSIKQAIDSYMLVNNGRYPDSLEQLVTPDSNGQKFLDTDVVPTDPWGVPYEYEVIDGGRDVRIYTLGKDGIAGGDGDNLDIDNIMIRNKEV